ncbi:MAG: hypothetical protein PHW56_03620 [Methanosarcinaceae archaeon]|nr:hypothetical protein [Methanosarcinaceae archaeon]
MECLMVKKYNMVVLSSFVRTPLFLPGFVSIFILKSPASCVGR